MYLTIMLTVSACGSGSDLTVPTSTAVPTTIIGTATTTAPSTTTAPATTTAPSTTPAPATTTEHSTTTTAAVDPLALVVATINLLHGLDYASDCAPWTDQCAAPARLRALWALIQNDLDCPDLVAFQEASPRQQELVPKMLPVLCDGRYRLVVDDRALPDQEMILTDLQILDEAYVELAGAPIWSAHWVRLKTGLGIVDVFATHFASSSFNLDCLGPEMAGCDEACVPGDDYGACHPRQALAFLRGLSDDAVLQLVVGDLNRPIGDSRIGTLIDAGFIDTYLAAGREECDPKTGLGCSCCVEGGLPLAGLDDPAARFTERIDFVLARPEVGCSLSVDLGTTDHWADRPLDSPVEGLWWAADHAGVVAGLSLTC